MKKTKNNKITTKFAHKKSLKNIFGERFDVNKTFEYNREKGPFVKVLDVNKKIKSILGKFGIETDFFGYKTKLPIGVAAGPLYNTRYMQAAMNDGFSVITWKTFRSVDRLAHRNDGKYLGHNIVFLENDQVLDGKDFRESIKGSLKYSGSPENITITNSFGMPSTNPIIWMRDILPIEKLAKKKNKLIITSVVGTPTSEGDIQDLATDYAFTARCAEMAGATAVELNFSCPNVHGKEGQIYKDYTNAMIVAKTVRGALLPDTKLLLKVGFAEVENYVEFIKMCGQYIDGIVAINTIPLKIIDEKGMQALPGGITSGTCGSIIINKSVEAVKNLVQARKLAGEKFNKLKIIGCGGVTNAENFMAHIEAGAEFVMCATAALFNPELPMQIAKYLKDNKINRKI